MIVKMENGDYVFYMENIQEKALQNILFASPLFKKEEEGNYMVARIETSTISLLELVRFLKKMKTLYNIKIKIHKSLYQKLKQYKEERDSREDIDGFLSYVEQVTGRKYYEFQREDIKRAIGNDAVFGFIHDVGLGKTFQTLSVLKYFPEIKVILIVAPKNPLYDWIKEINVVFSDERIKLFVRKVPKKITSDMIRFYDKIFILLNYELVKKIFSPKDAVSIKKSKYYTKLYKPQIKIDAIVVDEAHYIKNTTAQRTKYVLAASKHIKHRFALTATPISNRPDEFFPILHFLSPHEFPSKKKFLDRYAERERKIIKIATKTGVQLIEKVKYVRFKEAELPSLLENISNFVSIRTATEVANQLPDVVRKPIPIEIDNEILQHYMDIESAYLALVKFAKDYNLLQKLFGNIGGGLTKLMSMLSSYKTPDAVEYTMDLIEQGIDRVIVFFPYIEPLDKFKNLIKKKRVAAIGEISGRINDNERNRVRAWFNDETEEPRILVATIRAMREGVNLQRANHVIFVGVDWSPTSIKQAEGRVRRISSKYSSVFYHYMILESSFIESKVYNALNEKEEIIKQLKGEYEAAKEIANWVSENINSYKNKDRFWEYYGELEEIWENERDIEAIKNKIREWMSDAD